MIVQGLSDHTLRMLLADGPDEGDKRRRAVDTWVHGDIIGITELHVGEKHLRWAEESGGRFACSALPGEKDPAGGVGLILSVGAVRALKGDVQVEAGGRIIWARFAGEFHDFFVLVVYVPHRGRTAPPFQEEVMEQVAGVLRKHTKPGDCISLMGDFNGRLGRGRGGKGARVGRFTPHPREDEGGGCRGRSWRSSSCGRRRRSSSRRGGGATRGGSATAPTSWRRDRRRLCGWLGGNPSPPP